MKFIYIKVHIFILFISYSTALCAGEQVGNVVSITGGGSGPMNFYMSGVHSNRAACAADDVWSITNPASDNAKSLLSIILTAFATGKTISVHGTGACDAPATTREAVDYLSMY